MRFVHPARHLTCFRAHSCPVPHQFAANHPQIGQCKQRDELRGVFLEAEVTHLHKPELALDHPKGCSTLALMLALNFFALSIIEVDPIIETDLTVV